MRNREIVFLLLLAALLAACASPLPARGPAPIALGRRAAIVRAAMTQIGAPYRYGGSTPRGFDCSGLVVYSYGQAGLRVPRSASALESAAVTVALSAIEPGDLLFFRLGGWKTTHVGIYVGGQRFVHAPSSGKRVEQVGFEHPYWGPRVRRAGRLLR